MSKIYRLEVRITKKLNIAIKEVKASYNIETYDDLIQLLCQKIPRPKIYNNNYKPVYDGKFFRTLDMRISQDTLINFNTFTAVFTKQVHALDYLIDQEKTGRYNVVQF